MQPFRTEPLRLALLLLAAAVAAIGLPSPAAAASPAPVFADLPADHWAAPAVSFLASEGVLEGRGAGRFEPDADVTRAELARMSLALLPGGARRPKDGVVRFSDVPASHWAHAAVEAAAAAGIVEGTPEGLFEPDRPASRQEAAVILLRAAGLADGDRNADERDGTGLADFRDVAAVAPWARPALAAAVADGYLSGYPDGRLRPEAFLTRAEAAALLFRLLTRDRVADRPPFLVLGFAAVDYPGDDRSDRSLTAHAEHLTHIATFSYTVTGDGRIIGQAPASTLNLARRLDVPVLALLHNYTWPDGFDRGAAQRLLHDPSARRRLVRETLALVRRNGFDGINLDLENVAPEDRPALSQLVRELAAALRPAGFLLTVSVPPKLDDDPTHVWSGAFDYRALGQEVDYLVIMAYDEHYALSEPGPVASQPWVESVVAYAKGRVPARKLVLGLAAYGYDWPAEGPATSLPTLDVVALMDRTDGTVRWDEAAQSPEYTYVAGGTRHVVWFENEHTAAFKLRLARQEGLGGIALWRLGFESKAFWDSLDLYRPEPEPRPGAPDRRDPTTTPSTPMDR
ncbi:MAG: S-layer homology domain-containing protein [Clostridia bacterium]|nr:S-layer homology domain-containing protein [Clostridia bacterium]